MISTSHLNLPSFARDVCPIEHYYETDAKEAVEVAAVYSGVDVDDDTAAAAAAATSSLLSRLSPTQRTRRSLNALASSPPRTATDRDELPEYAIYSDNCADTAHRRQVKLNETRSVFLYHVVMQVWSVNKTIQVLCKTIINHAVSVAPMIGAPQGCFAHVAANAPFTMMPSERGKMIPYVEANVDLLVGEVIAALQGEINYRQDCGNDNGDSVPDGHTSIDLFDGIKMQMLSDVHETLQYISSTMIMRERHNNLLSRSYNACSATIRRQFDAHFDLSALLAADQTPADDDAAVECIICTNKFDGVKCTRTRLACCGQMLCTGCLSTTAFNSSELGCKTTGKCPFCSHTWQIYADKNDAGVCAKGAGQGGDVDIDPMPED